MRLASSVAVGVVLALSALPTHAQFFQHMFQQGGAGHNFFHTGGEQEAQAVGDASWFQERIRNGALRARLTQRNATSTCAATRSHASRNLANARARTPSRRGARSATATCA